MSKLILEKNSFFEYSTIPENEPFWVTHSKHWAKVIENSFPQIKAYIASDNRAINSETSFLPIYRIKRLFNKTSWLSIPYATISDPVLNMGTSVGQFLNLLTSHNLTKNCKIELRNLSIIQNTNGFNVCNGYLNHLLNLDASEDEIFRRFHRTAVQVHIRKSLESGITIKTGASLKDVGDFYRIYIQMRKELHLPPQPFIFFKNMWNELYSRNHVELLLAEHDNKVVAGLWILKNKWLYSFEYLARPCKNDRLRCAHFLYWHGIKRAISSNTPVVSFGRTSSNNTGLDLFKRRWGTSVVPYYDLVYPGTEGKPREDQLLFRIMQKVSPALPLPLFRMLGEIIYRII